MGPAPPVFELSFRRFPFKNVCQGPRDNESRSGGCREKQPLTSLLPPVLLPKLFHVLGKERASQVSTTSSRVEAVPARSSSASLLCHPQRHEGKRHQSPGRDQAGENNGKSCCSQRGGNDEGGSEWDGAEKGRQRRKGHLPTPANSKPSSPCCHSTLQRTLLRKSGGCAPRPSGGCSPGRPRRPEIGGLGVGGAWHQISMGRGGMNKLSGLH